MHDIKYRIDSKEDTCEWKHVNTYKQKIQDVPTTLFFVVKSYVFWNNLKLLQIN